MINLQDIIADLKDESCVLVLGPDILEYAYDSFFETLCKELIAYDKAEEWIDVSPQHIFLHEELLQLQPNAKQGSLIRFIKNFYEAQTQLDKPFEQIAQIPFHLIVSLMPDNRLGEVFQRQNFNYQYGYYPKEENPKPVDKPTKINPLIYNLTGDLSESDVVLTFDDFFSYLSGIMNKRELPHILEETLKKARTIVFLGVHFEKWNIQLLLRIITPQNKKDKFMLLKNQPADGSTAFVAKKRLEIDFLNFEPIDFLNALYEQCREHDLLKKVISKNKKKIFISYNHSDKPKVLDIKNALNEKNIEVIRDEEAMSGGEYIEDFMSIIASVDCVLLVVSKNSMLSPWVSKEIMMTIKTEKYLLPCYLDDEFLRPGFVEECNTYADLEIDRIFQEMKKRQAASIKDLVFKRENWVEYQNNLPDIIDKLKKINCVSLKPSDYDTGMEKIITTISKL